MKPIGTGLHHADFHFRSLEKFGRAEADSRSGLSLMHNANQGESVKTRRKNYTLR